jgi:thioredoxin reductase
MSDEALEHEEAFPRLTRDLLAVLAAAGERRMLTNGEVLSRAGEVAREFCVDVHLVVRRRDLAATMSRYLLDRIEAHPAIDIHFGAQVRELHGDESLHAVTIDGETGRIAADALFVFIGADPCHGMAEWGVGNRRGRVPPA